MHNSKRGAIELSMTTIIVIVIGVILLTLGLVWVRGVFSDVTDISDDAFTRARDIISGIENVNSLLTLIPEEIDLAQGKDEVVKVVIANFEEDPISVKVTTNTGDDNDLKCGFFVGGREIKTSVGTYTLESGDQKALSLIIKDNKGPLRPTSCAVRVNNDPNSEQTLAIHVIKEQGLFE